MLRELIDQLPRVPDVDEQGSHRQILRLQLEQNMAEELLATEFGVLMRRQQGHIDAMIQVAQAMIVDAEQAGTAAPAFLGRAIDEMIKLRMNLDILVWRERVLADILGYRRRHLDIIFDPSQPRFRAEIDEQFPMLEQIAQIYFMVADLRNHEFGFE